MRLNTIVRVDILDCFHLPITSSKFLNSVTQIFMIAYTGTVESRRKRIQLLPIILYLKWHIYLIQVFARIIFLLEN